MKTLNFILPACFASYFINSDPSGLNDEDIKLIDQFCLNNLLEYKYFNCIDVDIDNTYFSPFNDMPGMRNIGADVCTFTFAINY